MLKTSVLGLVATPGFAVHASSLFPVPLPLGHDRAIDPRLQVLGMGSVFGRAEVNTTTVYQSSFAMPTTAPQTSPAAQRRTYPVGEQPEGCPAGVEFVLLCSECGGFQIVYHEDVPRFSTHRCLGVGDNLQWKDCMCAHDSEKEYRDKGDPIIDESDDW